MVSWQRHHARRLLLLSQSSQTQNQRLHWVSTNPHPNAYCSAVCLGFAGACDSFSSVFRNTILQSATPDQLQGRLQAVFTVNTNGGPNLGKLFCGSVSQALSRISPVPLGLTAIIGGGLCVATVAALIRILPSFWKYDAAAQR